MYDLREHKELISQLVSEANQNDENWRWSVKSVGKEKARIFWEYLEYCGQKEPYFSIVLENTGDGCWITAKNEHGETMNSEIVEDKELPYLNTPLAEAITLMVHAIRNTAHACYCGHRPPVCSGHRFCGSRRADPQARVGRRSQRPGHWIVWLLPGLGG